MILNYNYENNYSGIFLVKQKQGKLFIVSGPSGVGKTTVVNKFLEEFGQLYGITRLVTYTTKKPRPNEVHAFDYHFVDSAEFEKKIESGFFLEWSNEYGSFYGTPGFVLQKLEQGFSYILIIDRIGAAQILKKYSDVVLIWIHLSSIDLLSGRLKSRNSESFEQIQTRLFLAKKEIEQELSTPMYHYYIENVDVKASVQAIFDVVSSCILLS